jgi:ParB family chromosome partitioning protein
LPLLSSKEAKLRQMAARAILWSTTVASLGALRDALRHDDAAVRQSAALGLAYYGDSAGASLLLSDNSVDIESRLAAALSLMSTSEDAFFAMLDHRDAPVRRRAWLVLLLQEFAQRHRIPDRMFAALSSAHPEVRLWAARALDSFSDDKAFEALVAAAFNKLGTSKVEWGVDLEIVKQVALGINFGEPKMRARMVYLLGALFEDTRDTFDRRWAILHGRYKDDLAKLAAEDRSIASVISERVARAWGAIKSALGSHDSPAQDEGFQRALTALVFGAYVGLSRDPGSEAVRRQAIEALTQLAQSGKANVRDTQRVLLASLGDASQEVRQRAFDALVTLSAEVSLLSTEALSTPWMDMGSRALSLLAERAGADGTELLKDAMWTKTGGLEEEAFKLLVEQAGATQTNLWALASQSASMRQRALQTLVKAYETDPAAKQGVHDALRSRFEDVRYSAAGALAHKNVAEAYNVLIEQLASTTPAQQRQAISNLRTLNLSQTPAALLDRIDNDPEKSALISDLIEAAASFRDHSIADRLFGYLSESVNKDRVMRGLITLSGYDQWLQDAEEEQADQSWVNNQHPRHDALLARLLDIAFRDADESIMQQLIPGARWAKSSVVEAPLEAIANVAQEHLHNAAVEALGWRLRKRAGSDRGLLRALASEQPMKQFLAAEALALVGRREGFTVLMASLSYLDDYSLQRRAVLALGKLADPQSLDRLLELAQDETSPLRGAAAEALGYMAASPRAQEILNVLRALVERGTSVAKDGLVGLSLFNTPEAWRVIHKYIDNRNNNWWVREEALKLIAKRRDDANIELLVKVLRDNREYWSTHNAAATSLRAMFDADSLEPDYLLVQACTSGLDAQEGALKRLREQPSVARLLDLLPKIHPDRERDFLEPIVGILTSLDPIPVADVAPALDAQDDRVATIAAQLIGRAASSAGGYRDALLRGVDYTHEQWASTWRAAKTQQSAALGRITQLTERYRWLAWAAGRLEVGADRLARILDVVPAESSTHALRSAALLAIADAWSGSAGEQTLAAVAGGLDPLLRAPAAEALARRAPAQASALIKEALEDAPRIRRLVSVASQEATSVLQEAASSAHYQGIALPHLIATGDASSLAALALNEKLNDETRLGAIEALAIVGGPKAEEALVAVGKDDEEDETLRKAAWRALRRSRRLSQKHQARQEVTP